MTAPKPASKPDAGARCDLSVGWHRDGFGAPVIDRCREPAVHVIETGRQGVWSEVWVCEKHKDWKPQDGMR